MKLGISPLLLLVFYISEIDPKEAKAHIYIASFNYLSITQYLTLVVGIPNNSKLEPASLFCYLGIACQNIVQCHQSFAFPLQYILWHNW